MVEDLFYSPDLEQEQWLRQSYLKQIAALYARLAKIEAQLAVLNEVAVTAVGKSIERKETQSN